MIVLHLDGVNKNVWTKQGFAVEYGDKINKNRNSWAKLVDNAVNSVHRLYLELDS